MNRRSLAAVAVATCAGMALPAGAADARTPCRTVVVHAGQARGRLVLHRCDRVKVEFLIGTQGEIFPDWEVARKPAAKILKFVSRGYGTPSSSDTATVIFTYRAVGKGRTSVKFGEYTASYPGVQLESFTLPVTVR
jgi:hypothetical protein